MRIYKQSCVYDILYLLGPLSSDLNRMGGLEAREEIFGVVSVQNESTPKSAVSRLPFPKAITRFHPELLCDKHED